MAGAAHPARYIGLVGKMMSVKILLFFQSRSWRFSLLSVRATVGGSIEHLSPSNGNNRHIGSQNMPFFAPMSLLLFCADIFFRPEPCLQKQNWPGLLSARYFSNLGLKEVLLKPDCPSLGLSAKLCLGNDISGLLGLWGWRDHCPFSNMHDCGWMRLKH